MSTKNASATKIKGPSACAKGYMPADKCARFQTKNVPSAATMNGKPNDRWVKKMVELTKTCRVLEGKSGGKLPANIRQSIRWFGSPFPMEWARRATRGTETGEAVPASS